MAPRGLARTMAAREKRTAEENRNFRMFRKLRLELDFTLTTTRNRLLIYVWHNSSYECSPALRFVPIDKGRFREPRTKFERSSSFPLLILISRISLLRRTSLSIDGTVTRQGPEKERLSLQGNDYELRKRQERCLRDARTSAKVKAA